MNLKKIKELIANDDLKAAIIELQQTKHEYDIEKEVLNFSARLQYLNQQVRRGSISIEHDNITRNQIRSDFLGLISDLENGDHSRFRRKRTKIKSYKGIFYVSFIMAILLTIISIYRSEITGIKGNNNSNNEIIIGDNSNIEKNYLIGPVKEDVGADFMKEVRHNSLIEYIKEKYGSPNKRTSVNGIDFFIWHFPSLTFTVGTTDGINVHYRKYEKFSNQLKFFFEENEEDYGIANIKETKYSDLYDNGSLMFRINAQVGAKVGIALNTLHGRAWKQEVLYVLSNPDAIAYCGIDSVNNKTINTIEILPSHIILESEKIEKFYNSYGSWYSRYSKEGEEMFERIQDCE